MTATAGRILGNLDCEADFATCLGRPGATRRPSFTRAATETAAGLATLLRAVARDGDRLWTPSAVAPPRLAEVPGLPRPALESGSLESLAPPREVLAWGETPAAAAHRRRAPEKEPEAAGHPGDPLHVRLWRLPASDPAVVAAVHHRAFALEVASGLGTALPGARMLASPAELAEHLRRVEPVLGSAGRWVLKAPLSAAGRWRVLGRGRPRDVVARRVERLFERHGPLLFEPWLERTADFGAAGLVDTREARLVAFHRSLVGRGGAFLGLELDVTFRGLRGLDRSERERLEEVFEGVARALRQRGYSGPFGIDCWRYRRAAAVSWNPLGEINARMTFGLVARALVDRVRAPAGLDPRATVRLRMSPPAPRDASPISSSDPRGTPRPAGEPANGGTAALVPLLLPAPQHRTAAWLEIPA